MGNSKKAESNLKLTTLLALVVVTLAFTACNKSNSGPDEDAIPSKLDAGLSGKITATPESGGYSVSANSSNYIYQSCLSQVRELPTPDAIFNESSADSDSSDLSTTGAATLKTIQANCVLKKSPVPHHSFADAHEGDVLDFGSTRSVLGDNCPVAYDYKLVAPATISHLQLAQNDDQESDIKMRMKVDIAQVNKVIDQELQTRSRHIFDSINATGTLREHYHGKSGSTMTSSYGHLTASGVTHLSDKNDISTQMEVEMIALENAPKMTQVYIKMTGSQGSITLGSIDDKAGPRRFYLNGVQVTSDEIKAKFGTDVFKSFSTN